MDIDLKELFDKYPFLLQEPINLSEIKERIKDFVRVKNKQYLDSLKGSN